MSTTVSGEPLIVHVESESDIVTARNTGRTMAATLSFSSTELTLIATAISEVARNIAIYASPGRIELQLAEDGIRRGIRIVAVDDGPGIPDVHLAMQDGYSTGKSLGIGLPGARRLMDDFEIRSEVGVGTTVTMTKWKR